MASERKSSKTASTQAGQSHLPQAASAAAEESMRIDKLVSLTYDSNPEIRRQAAEKLAEIDDPRAIFALLELVADKDQKVQETARAALENFKGEEKEALVSLEKIFEAKQEGKTTPQDIEIARKKLMPSIEKLFSKNKEVKEKLMPSIEKLFSWIPPSSPSQGAKEQPQGQPSPSIPSSAKTSFEQVATAHMRYRENELDKSRGEKEEIADAIPASAPISALQEQAEGKMGAKGLRSLIEQAEADVGVPAHLLSVQELKRMRSSSAHAAKEKQPASQPLYQSQAIKQRMEEATNFPIPEYLQPKPPSPVASIPSMLDEPPLEQVVEEEGVKMPRHALYYYKLAYAIALTPGIKASEIKKHKERLIKEAKQDIELAFELAIKRTHHEGIESLAGLKPGMKRLSTLPLEVLDNVVVSVPHGKKLVAYNRILLSDGRHQLPLYVQPPRADGIKPGDLLSLRDAMVDYWVNPNPIAGSPPGELVLLLGKNGQLIVTK